MLYSGHGSKQVDYSKRCIMLGKPIVDDKCPECGRDLYYDEWETGDGVFCVGGDWGDVGTFGYAEKYLEN